MKEAASNNFISILPYAKPLSSKWLEALKMKGEFKCWGVKLQYKVVKAFEKYFVFYQDTIELHAAGLEFYQWLINVDK